MEYQINQDKEVTLKLSQNEFNEVLCGIGASSNNDRKLIAEKYDFEVFTIGRLSHKFYNELYNVAKEMNNYEL